MAVGSRCVAGALALACTAGAVELRLADAGTTTYRIVTPAGPSSVDDYAVKTLAGCLKQITGAEFPVVGPDTVTAAQPAIFVGLSAPALARLGPEPLAPLQDQAHVARSLGPDVFLYGKGLHGNLHAAMLFLETELGWRWYSVFSKPLLPARPTVSLPPFERQRGFSFASREVGLRFGLDFYYQNGINMGFDRSTRRLRQQDPAAAAGIEPLRPNEKFVHSSFSYIPPTPDTVYSKDFEWLPRRDYFATNPDFFTLNLAGQRVPNRQLCFSNPALRAELTRNVLTHAARAPEDNLFTLDAADNPEAFCHCPGCQALATKYGSPGGPIYDYLIELCERLRSERPRAMVKTLAYRRSQTQKPPVLPAGQRLPANLIVSFAPIEDSYFGDWTHPDPRLQETYADLVAWGKVATHLWAWLYPNPWGSGAHMPVGNLERLINAMRLMHQAGVTGVFTDHNGGNERAGLSELQSYLLYRLMQDVSCDTAAVIREFTDHHYGAAGALVRTYLSELELARKSLTTLPPGTTYRSSNYDDDTFPYLTTANIRRWQTLFDHMEGAVTGDAEPLLNVRLLRRELDFATLWKWFDLQRAYPEYFTDAAVPAGRITAANAAKAPAGMQPRPLGKDTLADFLAVIQGGGREKPLPPELAEVAPDRVRTFIPTNSGRQSGPRCVPDPDAARGFAVTVHKPDLPFQVGFYTWTSRQPPAGTHGPRLSLARDAITPGAYRLYRLGAITAAPDCWIWFSAQSWETRVELGERLYEPGAGNRWEAYVSVKFDGPTYGGRAAEDLVLVDRVILVRQAAE